MKFQIANKINYTYIPITDYSHKMAESFTEALALLPLVTECEPNKTVPLEYNSHCWHCNPDYIIYPQPQPQNQLSNGLGFVDLLPSVTKPTLASEYISSVIKRKQEQRLVFKERQLKSFDLTDKNKIVGTTHTMTSDDILYSRQRMFMITFGIDILNKDQLVNFNKIMKAFMTELDYTPTDKQDVVLFYTQESSQDLYDVYLARRNKYIKKFAQVFKVNLGHYDEAIEFMQLIKCYMTTTDEYNNINSTSNVLRFFREQDADNVYLITKMAGLKM